MSVQRIRAWRETYHSLPTERRAEYYSTHIWPTIEFMYDLWHRDYQLEQRVVNVLSVVQDRLMQNIPFGHLEGDNRIHGRICKMVLESA
jgi:hypothetical protein